MENVVQGWTLPIIRHMSANENLLGLGSMWDVERDNANLDTMREDARDRRSRLYTRDAIVALGLEAGLSVSASGVEQPVHARRLGLGWIDGTLCGTRERAIIPFGRIVTVSTESTCECGQFTVRDYPFVPLGAVFRELERSVSEVTVICGRRGVRGRVTGVWRDALTVKSTIAETVIPVSMLSVVIVETIRWT